MPGHDMTRFYALIPLLATLGALNPNALEQIALAIGIVGSLRQMR
jgi:hypothetical protein